MQTATLRYKYKLKTKANTFELYQACNVAGLVWNHCIALQRRYYKLTGKHIPYSTLQAHIGTKLRMRRPKYGHWKRYLNAQATQGIVRRVDVAYDRFFKGLSRLPRFKKVKKYSSFELTQNGWKLLDSKSRRYGKIRIFGKVYRFHLHRVLVGRISSVSVIRKGGRYWLSFVLKNVPVEQRQAEYERQAAAFDFGLKTFLTADDGTKYDSPAFYGLKRNLRALKRANRRLSRKQKGSKNWDRANRQLQRLQFHIANLRADYHWKLAHELCQRHQILIFETLNIDGMKRLWGRKVSDLGFYSFLKKLEWVKEKYGTEIVPIDQWEATSKTCSCCGHVQEMPLRQRVYECGGCSMVLDRDHNAARNIYRAGMALCQREQSDGACAAVPLDDELVLRGAP